MKVFGFILILLFALNGSMFAYGKGPAVKVDESTEHTYVFDRSANLVDQHIQELVFFHTSDLHGYAFNNALLKPGKDKVSGGLFSLATLVADRRKKSSFRRWALDLNIFTRKKMDLNDDGIFLVDCGDAVSGTFNDSLRVGEDITRLMNSSILDYDVKTIGNHSADYGVKPMFRNIAMTEFPVVIANAVEETTGKQLKGTVPYIILESFGVKVGFIGLSNVWSTRIKGVKMLDIVETLNKYVPMLRKKADLIVCVAHVGFEREAGIVSDIAKMDDGNPMMNVDLILDAHSHANIHFLVDEDTLVTQAGKYGFNAGEAIVRYNRRQKKVAAVRVEKHPLTTSNYSPSRDLLNEFRALTEQVRKENGGVLVDGLDDFFIRKPLRTDPALANPAAEFSARAFYEVALKEGFKPDCSIVYHKGIRNHIASNDRGEITNGIIHKALPFEENLVIAEISGKRLKEFMNYGMKKKFLWAGMQGKVQEKIEKGKLVERKLVELKIFNRASKRFVPVNEKKTYRVACNAFFGRVYVKPGKGNTIDTGMTDKKALVQFLKLYKNERNRFFNDQDVLSRAIIYKK